MFDAMYVCMSVRETCTIQFLRYMHPERDE